MKNFCNMRALFRLGVWVELLSIPAVVMAAESRDPGTHAKNAQRTAEPEVVDLFAAAATGQIQARLIVRDANHCRLEVQNCGDTPLSVQLPEAFAGTPVLAQQTSAAAIGNPGATQALGTAPPATLFPANSTSAFLNVPPEATGQLTLRSVCLERYKKGPSPRIPYEVKPLSQITDKPEVCELCRMLSCDDVDLRPVQAAVWHVNNNLDWDRLLRRFVTSPLPDPAHFTQMELLGAAATGVGSASGGPTGQETNRHFSEPTMIAGGEGPPRSACRGASSAHAERSPEHGQAVS